MFLYFLIVLPLFMFSNGNEKYSHLGSKTPYRFIANNNVTEPIYAGCTIKKIWMVNRHGTRNPDVDDIEEMKKNITSIRDEILLYSNLSLTIKNHLKNWKVLVDEKDEMQLTEEGRREMFSLAQRMQKRYPLLFPFDYSNQTYSFKYTSSDRTNDSAQAFVIGLFGQEGSNDVQYGHSEHDNFILKFYDYCDNWIHQVDDNPEAYEEKRLFDESSVMEHAVNAINEELNLKTKLTKEAVRLIYTTCTYETAWNEGRSIWCHFLTLHLMKILEFSDNLESYYEHGYGYSISYEQACPLFKNMIDHFSSNDASPTTAVYFTHSGTILKFLAHLGLYKDDAPLKHTDFNNGTKWNESKLDAFGTNIEFVLYRCGNEDKVAVYHQERIVTLPNCTELCDMASLKETYHASIDCQFNKICYS